MILICFSSLWPLCHIETQEITETSDLCSFKDWVIFLKDHWRKQHVYQLGNDLVLKAWWICVPSTGTRSIHLLNWNWVIFISSAGTGYPRAGKVLALLPAVP